MAPVEAEQSKTSPGGKERCMLSPRFRSAAAMAGWDEEALLAGLVVEDTPVRDLKRSKRLSKTPTTGSKRKRRSQKRSPCSVPVVALCLDEEEENRVNKDGLGMKVEATSTEEAKTDVEIERRDTMSDKNEPTKSTLPCIDRLREELSCAICLDICFEPSTTPCGHSFCLKCLKYAASKCGKRCPKCRDLIGNARSCTVNTVLWNTIQLLFPEEVEARRKKPTSPKPQTASKTLQHAVMPAARHSIPNRSAFILSSELVSEAELARNRRRQSSGDGGDRGRLSLTQSQDAALALRLQREEFMGSVVERRELHRSPSVHSARANLRAMASRAVQGRTRSGRYC